MREEEIDSLVAADIARDEAELSAQMKMAAERITKVFEVVFQDFRASIEIMTDGYAAGDPRKDALYSVQGAIDMMDIAYAVREALDVPHPV